MLIWKRQVGQGIMIGNDSLIMVRKVTDSSGAPVIGCDVSLAVNTAPDIRTERLETYKAGATQAVGFPYFYRVVPRAHGASGYSLNLPPEADLRSDGYDFVRVEGFADMRREDDRLELHIFRSESEALAFRSGVELADVESRTAMVHTRREQVWLVLVHWYDESYIDGPNPTIRDHRKTPPIAVSTGQRALQS